MNPYADHAAGCVLDPVNWLRHAVGAAIRLVRTDVPDADEDRPDVDDISALALLTELERLAEFDDHWGRVTLREIVVNASPIGERDQGNCTCGRWKEGTGSSG